MQDMSPHEAFDRYETLRPRLPDAGPQGAGVALASLADMQDHVDAFVFDAYGVLNVGDTPIEGAFQRIHALRAAGKEVLVLTNAASFNRAQTEAKFKGLGFDFAPHEIISSREVCEARLPAEGLWGVMAPDGFDANDLPVRAVALDDNPEIYGRVEGFLLLSSATWTPGRQAMLMASLTQVPRPVIVANPDLVAPRETGLSLEPGFFAQELQDKLNLQAQFHGKPFPSVYEEVEARLPGIAPDRIAMVGDTLHTDVLGAQSRSWHSVLVTDHGLFAGLDVDGFITKSGIKPDWIVPSI
ncbi:HAD-IIA family hydrolase [Epibacterium ulvae]|uniref:HAD-IIA family hydrolase n=1 Tax=Epibacterium ulvae TaxID=1156985 RepID=UPI002491CED5|nr:HAD hydrolase-like protein [Epibacterium ulvae]